MFTGGPSTLADKNPQRGPGTGVELIGQEFELNARFAFGVEVTAGITTEGFNQMVDALGQVGGTDLLADGGRILHEGQIEGKEGLAQIGLLSSGKATTDEQGPTRIRG
jgi:hypothetical protein